MGVVLHKDSKWYQQWKDFKDNNAVFNSKTILPASASTLQWSKCCIIDRVDACKLLFRQQVASDSIQTNLTFPDFCHTALSAALVSLRVL